MNGVTRKTIFEQLNKIHKFNADGMFAPIDLAGRKISTCSVTMQVKNGDVRAGEPDEAGHVRVLPEQRHHPQARHLRHRAEPAASATR